MKKGILLVRKYYILISWARPAVEKNWSGKMQVVKCVQDVRNSLSVAKNDLLCSLQHFLLSWYKSPDV